MLSKARNLLKGLRKDLSAAGAGAQVHGARRRIKRLRSLSLLVRPAIGEVAHDIARRHLKTAADALAGPRRAEALASAVDKLEPNLPHRHGLTDVIAIYGEAIADHGANPEPLDAASAAIDEFAAALATWKLPRNNAPFLTEAFAATYRKARKRLAAGLKSGNVEELHDARKHVIHHLHHLELLADALPQDPGERIGRLDGLREALGELNDLNELEELARAHKHALPKGVRKVLRARHKTLLRRARKAWKPLFGTGTKTFVKRIGAMWPLSAR